MRKLEPLNVDVCGDHTGAVNSYMVAKGEGMDAGNFTADELAPFDGGAKKIAQMLSSNGKLVTAEIGASKQHSISEEKRLLVLLKEMELVQPVGVT